jgi:transcriptional regulator with XRE-family HTH domain
MSKSDQEKVLAAMRLRVLALATGQELQAVAEAMGISKSLLSHKMSGRRGVRPREFAAIVGYLHGFGVRPYTIVVESDDDEEQPFSLSIMATSATAALRAVAETIAS